jgi:hypothetical protein
MTNDLLASSCCGVAVRRRQDFRKGKDIIALLLMAFVSLALWLLMRPGTIIGR